MATFGSTMSKQPEVTILLAEDEEAILYGVADLLECAADRYTITTYKATNGREALQLLQEITPDLIISDWQMPKMDGDEFLRTVRQNPAWIHIPFIFLTAKVSHQDIFHGRLVGVELYITKPFESQELLDLVQMLLDKTLLQQKKRRQASEEMKRKMLHLLQHEFRTPLTYVTAYYELLVMSYDETANSQELQEFLHGIQSGSRRMSKLIQDLLMALELRTGEMAAQLQKEARPIDDLAVLLNSVVEEYRPSAFNSKVEIKMAIPPRLPRLLGDPVLLRDLFSRLVDNGVKFSAKKGKGTVTISAETTPKNLIIQIADDGIGFPASIAPQLFELFHQHNREHWEQQGPGVGLTIAKGIAEMHGGQLRAMGQEGVGATFTVELPIYQLNAPSPLVLTSITHAKRATLLVVEDDALLLEATLELLLLEEEPYQYDLLSAMNGEEAIAILEKQLPDLILSDITMPRMDGYQLLKRIRETPAWSLLPFIFLSGQNRHKEIVKARLAGADDYITKPYDPLELRKLLETRLNRHFQSQETTQNDFEVVRRHILLAIESGFANSLSKVSDHAGLIQEQLTRSETIGDLKRFLEGIQEGSNTLSHLVDNFTTIVELRTGAAQTAYELRLRSVEYMGAMMQEVCEAERSKWRNEHGKSADVPHDYAVSFTIPAIKCDPQAICKTFERAYNFIRTHSDKIDSARLFISAESTPTHHVFKIKTTASTLTSAEHEQITQFLNGADETTLTIETGMLDLTIAKEYLLLHKGELRSEYDKNSHTLIALLPAS